MSLDSNIEKRLQEIGRLTKLPKNHILSFKQYVLDNDDTFYLEIGYDLKIKAANSSFVKFLGLRRPDILGKSVSDFVGVEESEATQKRLLETGHVKKVIELNGKKFLALVFKIDNQELFGEYLIEII